MIFNRVRLGVEWIHLSQEKCLDVNPTFQGTGEEEGGGRKADSNNNCFKLNTLFPPRITPIAALPLSNTHTPVNTSLF